MPTLDSERAMLEMELEDINAALNDFDRRVPKGWSEDLRASHLDYLLTRKFEIETDLSLDSQRRGLNLSEY